MTVVDDLLSGRRIKEPAAPQALDPKGMEGAALPTPPPAKPEVRRLAPGEFRANPDGSRSTEISITTRHPSLNQGRWTNIPSLWMIGDQPHEVEEEMAVRFAATSGEEFPSFETMEEAVAAAKARSDAGGRFSDLPTAEDLAARPGMPQPRESAPSAAPEDYAPIPQPVGHGLGGRPTTEGRDAPVASSAAEIPGAVSGSEPPVAPLNVVDELLGGAPPPGPEPAPEASERTLLERGARFLGDWNLSAAQGATFGYSDEAAAWIGEQLGFGEYKDLLKGIRERQEEIPSSVAIPGEIAGGIGSAAAMSAIPGGQAAAGTRIGSTIARLPGWAKAAGLGSIFGGLYGSGTAEEGERLESAAEGALVGGTASGVLYPVGSLVRSGVREVGRQIRVRTSPEQEALAQIRRAFARDEMTPAKLRSRLRELGPQATLADAAGKNTQRLVGSAAGTPGRAQNRVEQILTQRAEGEGERIIRAINRGVSLDDFYAAEEAFLNNLRSKAAPLYEQAYQQHQSIMTPSLKQIIRSKTGRKAMQEAASLLEIERGAGVPSYLGAVDDELTAALRSARDVGKTPGIGKIQPGVVKGFSLRTWDMVKRGLDSLMDNKAYRNELTGRLNERGRAVAMLKKTLTRELDKSTGGKQGSYAQARKIYSGDAEALDALREGRKALTKDPEVITRELADLSDAAREAYRAGAARALRDVVEKTPDTASAANRLFGTTVKRKQLRALFPDQKDFNQLRRTLVSEQRFQKTRNIVLGGSPTREKLAAESDLLQKAAGAAAVMSGSSGGIMLAAMRRRAAEALFGPSNEKFLSDITKMLVSRNQAMNQRAIDRVFSRMGMGSAPEQVKRETATWLVPMIVGQRSGEAMSP